MSIVSFQKFGNHKLITLKYFVKGLMNDLLFVLNSMIQDNVQPVLAYVQLCDGVILNYLEN